jgi:uncharacterized membrane protein
MEQELNQKPKEEKANEEEKIDVESNKYVAALSYLWILCFVPLFLKRNSKFAQFHAKQGLILFIVEVVGPVIFWIPLIGWMLWIAVLVLAIMGIIQALSGKNWEMPVLGKYAQKINL